MNQTNSYIIIGFLFISLFFSILCHSLHFTYGFKPSIVNKTDKIDKTNIDEINIKDFHSLLNIANRSLINEDYEDALILYEKALTITPTNFFALSGKGDALNKLGKYQEAITWYDKALEKYPDYLVLVNSRNNALNIQGEHSDSVIWYDKALEKYPDYTSVLVHKGEALNSLGKYEEALKWYERALKIDPGNVNAIDKRDSILTALGKN